MSQITILRYLTLKMENVKNVKMQFSFIINSMHNYEPKNVNSVNILHF